jgi:cyclic-di-GMP phosphodiesterase TipF (flagellum assembly factor)
MQGRDMSLILFIISFAVIGGAVALVLPTAMGIAQMTSYLIGGGTFLLGLNLYGLVQLRIQRNDTDDRMADVSHDLVEITGTVNNMLSEMDDLSSNLDEGKGRSRELVAEVKVLQTLLSQLAGNKAQSVAKGPRTAVSLKQQKKAAKVVSAQAGSAGNGGLVVAKSEIELRALAPRDEAEIYEIIRNALQDNRVDLYLQPIVTLPSRKTIHYECYSRVRDEAGLVLFPRDYLPVAKESGLTGTLDNLLLFRCMQVARRLGPRRPNVRFFCNISSASLNDEEFFPQFIDFMLSNYKLADRMVFEFSQVDVQNMNDKVQRSLLRLGENGYRFSMDHVADLSIDIPRLAQHFFKYIKVDTDVLLGQKSDILTADLKEAMSRFDIELIAAKIESEPSVLDVLDNNIDYGQGYLFGEPKPSRQRYSADGNAADRPN